MQAAATTYKYPQYEFMGAYQEKKNINFQANGELWR
jgi:hypothetical protein